MGDSEQSSTSSHVDSILRLHAILPQSRANGPGVRMVIWFQGCTLACPGCFNPATHTSEPILFLPVEELVHRVEAEKSALEGITISGGEPLQQPSGLLELLAGIRGRTALSVILFSGYTLEEVREMPLGHKVLRHVDVLIDGRFVAAQRLAQGLRGSANQKIHLLTNRYTREEIEKTPLAEVRIDSAANIVVSGVDPIRISREMPSRLG